MNKSLEELQTLGNQENLAAIKELISFYSTPGQLNGTAFMQWLKKMADLKEPLAVFDLGLIYCKYPQGEFVKLFEGTLNIYEDVKEGFNLIDEAIRLERFNNNPVTLYKFYDEASQVMEFFTKKLGEGNGPFQSHEEVDNAFEKKISYYQGVIDTISNNLDSFPKDMAEPIVDKFKELVQLAKEEWEAVKVARKALIGVLNTTSNLSDKPRKFCTNCGDNLPRDMKKFCPNCGEKIAGDVTPSVLSRTTNPLANKSLDNYVLMLKIGSSLLCLFFFMPWISVDLWFERLSASGWYIATEFEVPSFYFFLLMPIALVGISFSQITKKSFGYIQVISVVGILAMLMAIMHMLGDVQLGISFSEFIEYFATIWLYAIFIVYGAMIYVCHKATELAQE